MSHELNEYIRKENLKLEGDGYSLDRDWLKYLLYDIESSVNEKTRILELGCGDGNSLIDICRDSKVLASNCTGTSLQPLPNHKVMRSYGINVKTGILSHELPSSWTKKFDITMTCAMLMHVHDLEQVTNELFRVTSDNGYILIYDLRNVVKSVENMALQRKYKIIQPRHAMIENMFGSVIQKQSI